MPPFLALVGGLGGMLTSVSLCFTTLSLIRYEGPRRRRIADGCRPPGLARRVAYDSLETPEDGWTSLRESWPRVPLPEVRSASLAQGQPKPARWTPTEKTRREVTPWSLPQR